MSFCVLPNTFIKTMTILSTRSQAARSTLENALRNSLTWGSTPNSFKTNAFQLEPLTGLGDRNGPQGAGFHAGPHRPSGQEGDAEPAHGQFEDGARSARPAGRLRAERPLTRETSW